MRSSRSLVLVLVLAGACGGGDDGLPAFFDDKPAYGDGPLPAGAVEVTADQLIAIAQSGGTIEWLTAAQLQQLRDDAAAQLAADRALVDTAVAADPVLAAQLAVPLATDPTVVADPGGTTLALMNPDGTARSVRLDGADVEISGLATRLRRGAERENALALYQDSYAMLSEESRADLPADPATLTDAELQALVDTAADRVVAELPNESIGSLPSSGCPSSPAPSLVADFAFASRPGLPPIRDQGARGSCTAFAVVGGLEAFVRQNHGRATDLSEQQLYGKGKTAWYPPADPTSPSADGLPYGVFTHIAVNAYPVHTEREWSYNQSLDREWGEIGVENNQAVFGFSNSCLGYDETCAETVDQLGLFCVVVSATARYCLRRNPVDEADLDAERVGLNHYADLMRLTPNKTLQAIRASLLTGHTVAIAGRLPYCFMTPGGWSAADGYDHDYKLECPEADGTIGRHAMLAVGFITEGELAARYTPAQRDQGPRPGNGGFLVIRNSWGCNGGSGYVYFPADLARRFIDQAFSVSSVFAELPRVTLFGNKATTGVPGSYTLTAVASPVVSRVTFYKRRTLFGRGEVVAVDTSPPFTTPVTFAAGDAGTNKFYAIASDPAGNTATSNFVQVQVATPPAILSFTATPSALPAGGGTTTLAWVVSGAAQVVIDHGVGDVTGQTSVAASVSFTRTFTLTATNANGFTQQMVTVTVDPGGGGDDRFVDPVAGLDTNPGTQAAPFKTIDHAAAVTPAGATIWLADGVFDAASEGLTPGDATLYLPTGVIISAINPGQAQLRVRLQPSGDLTLSGVAFDQATNSTWYSIYAASGVITLHGVTFANTDIPGDAALELAGSAQATLDTGGAIGLDYAGPNVHGFASVTGGASLTITGGVIDGAGRDGLASLRGVLTTTNLAALTLDGVAITNSDFASSLSSSAVVLAQGSSQLQLTSAVIDGATADPATTTHAVMLLDSANAAVTGTTLANMGYGLNGTNAGIEVAGSGGQSLQVTGGLIGGNAFGIRVESSATVTVQTARVTGNALAGIELTAGGSLSLASSVLDVNWPVANPGGQVTYGTALGVLGAYPYAVTVRGTTFTMNGNASDTLPRAVRLGGDAASTFDLGTAASPGNNRFLVNTGGSVSVAVDPAVVVRASGNIWDPVQGADATGHYVIGNSPCGATAPCQVAAGAGANYTIVSGTLRLVE